MLKKDDRIRLHRSLLKEGDADRFGTVIVRVAGIAGKEDSDGLGVLVRWDDGTRSSVRWSDAIPVEAP